MKTFLKIFLVSILFSFAGCLNYKQDVILNPDGSGQMKIEYWKKLQDDGSRNMVNNFGIFSPDSIRNKFLFDPSIVRGSLAQRFCHDA